jgi:hypothetical protein
VKYHVWNPIFLFSIHYRWAYYFFTFYLHCIEMIYFVINFFSWFPELWHFIFKKATFIRKRKDFCSPKSVAADTRSIFFSCCFLLIESIKDQIWILIEFIYDIFVWWVDNTVLMRIKNDCSKDIWMAEPLVMMMTIMIVLVMMKCMPNDIICMN